MEGQDFIAENITFENSAPEVMRWAWRYFSRSFAAADVVDRQIFVRMSESRERRRRGERKEGGEDKERIVKEIVISFVSWVLKLVK